MPVRRILVAGLLAITIGASVTTGGAAESPGAGGALAEPLDSGQTWTIDAAIVSSANLALMTYAGLSPSLRRKLEWQASAIAKLRRVSLARVIAGDPRQALLLSLAPVERQGLPKSVMDLLEERLHARGDLTLGVTEDPAGDTAIDPQGGAPLPVMDWTVRIGRTTRQAFLYGLRLKHQAKFDVPIHGIALDDVMAISESPLYQHDTLETVQLGFQPGQIVATDGDAPFLLPDINAFIDLEQTLLDGILQFGPGPSSKPDSWTTGVKGILVLKQLFRGDMDDPTTPEDERLTPHSDGEIFNALFGADVFFSSNSQRLTAFDPTIVTTPLEVLPASTFTGASSEAVARALIENNALNNARAYGYDPDAYDRIILMMRQLFDIPNGYAAVGGKVVMVFGVRSSLVTTLTHELGPIVQPGFSSPP
jgi:hypothetical protein